MRLSKHCKYAYFCEAMLTFTDQTGHTITLRETPKRIISIVPSQSEFLWDIGLQNQLVGITKFCIHPKEMYTSVTRVGGTKKLNIEKIRELKPDLIIGNKEENEKEQIEQLQKEFNVWMSDIYNFDDSFAMMQSLGEITGKREEADNWVSKIKSELIPIKNIFPKKKVLYFIWKDPYMIAAGNTFIDHVLNYIGLENAANQLQRYPEMSEEVLKNIEPEVCFLSSEPYPFKEKDIEDINRILPDCKIKIMDGEVFSWYGSRLHDLPAYLKKLEI